MIYFCLNKISFSYLLTLSPIESKIHQLGNEMILKEKNSEEKMTKQKITSRSQRKYTFVHIRGKEEAREDEEGNAHPPLDNNQCLFAYSLTTIYQKRGIRRGTESNSFK